MSSSVLGGNSSATALACCGQRSRKRVQGTCQSAMHAVLRQLVRAVLCSRSSSTWSRSTRRRHRAPRAASPAPCWQPSTSPRCRTASTTASTSRSTASARERSATSSSTSSVRCRRAVASSRPTTTCTSFIRRRRHPPLRERRAFATSSDSTNCANFVVSSQTNGRAAASATSRILYDASYFHSRSYSSTTILLHCRFIGRKENTCVLKMFRRLWNSFFVSL